MKYLLDTNICIYIINSRPSKVLNRFKEFAVGDIAVSTITVYELMYGVYKSRYEEKNLCALRAFLSPLEILSFDEACADFCGRVRAYLEKEGKMIGSMDIQIAATALAYNMTLVTNNVGEFRNVHSLKIDNWA